MPKIVIIGAGSHVFSRHLITDILSYPELRESTITLVDIATEPLALITAFADKLVKQHRLPTRIESTSDRKAPIMFLLLFVWEDRRYCSRIRRQNFMESN